MFSFNQMVKIKTKNKIKKMKNKKLISLQAYLPATKKEKSIKKRTSQFLLLCINQKGSMTVELSILLPVFLFIMLGFFTWGKLLLLDNEIHHSMVEAAREMARQKYKLQTDKLEKLDGAAFYLLWRSQTDLDMVSKTNVVGGKNGILLEEYKEENGKIKVRMGYQARITIPLIGTYTSHFTNRVEQKEFTGYEYKTQNSETQNNEIVYVAEYGKVYHKNANCTHINLSITKDTDALPYVEGKTKFKPCEKCAKYYNGTPFKVYITSWGDAYHTDLGCSGLTRQIYRMKKSTVNLPPCEKCAAQ